ncbi:hypothetical protein [Clostridium ganghwense]|uniref:Uncharacterized protein n=1 Tax=Clostridium ganghwense TaxID=312089 RepID=A0ABT4CTL0_9CLOT|nr:hypothetical protein [Clostridium ganghwense]MCY6372410.1 hypothetical protein [Clostridium ganghwense]
MIIPIIKLSIQTSAIDWINAVCSIITAAGVIGGGIWTYNTYLKTKNKEMYEKVLLSVYAPLYKILYRQEFIRDNMLLRKDCPNKDTSTTDCAPILDIETCKNGIIISQIGRCEIIEKTKEMNLAYASPKLIELLSAYEFACKFQDKHKSDYHMYIDECKKDINDINENTKQIAHSYVAFDISIHNIEKDLILEIIRGFKQYKKMLGLDKDCSVENNEINNKYKVDFDEIKKQIESDCQK